MWICPVCKFVSPTGGACPCSVNYDGAEIILNYFEDDRMANTIKYTGNLDRFAGQRTGKLLSAELQIVKDIKQELKDHIGGDLPRGSSILCVYLGEKGIPFAELRNYGSSALSRLKKSVGQVFEIDVPITAVKQVELDYGANDDSDLPEKSPVAETVLQDNEVDPAGTDRSVGTGVSPETPAAILPESTESRDDGQKAEAVDRNKDTEEL